MPQNAPLSAEGRVGSTDRRPEPGIEHEHKADQPDGEADKGVGHMGRQRPGNADPENAARQHDFQVPAAPVAPVDPHRNQVLRDHDRQHDRGCLERRQDDRQQGSRDRSDAGKAALAEAERRHRRNGEKIKKRIVDDGHKVGRDARGGEIAAGSKPRRAADARSISARPR